MVNETTIILIVILFPICACLCLAPTIIFVKRYLADYPDVVQNRFTVEELFNTIDIIIATEIAIYEEYLSNTSDSTLDMPLTNAQFINIYNDLSNRILHGISPTFYRIAEVYMTESELQTFITQRVYNYLARKVAPDDIEPEGDED